MKSGHVFRAIACLAAACALGEAAQNAPTKEQPPAGGPAKPFKTPASQAFTLPNGLRVTLVSYGLIPKVTAELFLRGGTISEPAGKDGVAMVLAELMKEGTTSRSSERFAQEIGALGGDFSVSAEADQLRVHATALSDAADSLLQLMADATQHPALPESQLNRIKQNVLRTISVQRASSPFQAREAFHRLVYGDNGYGRLLPGEASVRALTMDDIRAYYNRHVTAANAHLYVAGVLSPGIRQAITAAFGPWPQGKQPEIPAVKARTNRTLQLVDRPGAAQSTVVLGLPVTGPAESDAIRLQVADSLLGGSFISRITSNIREKKGYTYSPFSAVEERVGNGVWFEAADVTTNVTGPAIHEIYDEIGRLRKTPPPADELKGIQNGMAGVFVLRNSSRLGIIRQLNRVDLYGLPSNYLDTYVDQVLAVTPAQVQGTTEKYLNPDQMTLVVVGDKSAIASQVAPFAPSAQQ